MEMPQAVLFATRSIPTLLRQTTALFAGRKWMGGLTMKARELAEMLMEQEFNLKLFKRRVNE